MVERLSETARGRWHGILPQLGISPKVLRNKHGPCPMCGGKDRFRFDDREGKGTWICNRCGSGDGAELVKRVKEVSFKEAAKMVEAVAGTVRQRTERSRIEVDRTELNRHWGIGRPIERDSVAGRYLHQRCGLTEFPSCLRTFETDGMAGCGQAAEIMALVSDQEGRPVTLHRTFIPSGTNGSKREWSPDRKLMPGKLPDNVAIRLAGFRNDEFLGGGLGTLGIAEGIETALSASSLFHIPVWSAISAPLLKKWRPPAGVKKVIIFGDNDESFTGQEAAYALARSLSGDVEVEVKIPTLPGQDWNDVLRDIWSKS
jgi:putative DNA primase/helicase